MARRSPRMFTGDPGAPRPGAFARHMESEGSGYTVNAAGLPRP